MSPVERPAWLSAESATLIDLFEEAAARLRDGWTADRQEARDQAEQEMIEAIRSDVQRDARTEGGAQ